MSSLFVSFRLSVGDRPAGIFLGFSLAVVCLAVWPNGAAAQFLPPGIVNPFADVDPGEDMYVSHVIEDDGTMHAVWASNNPYPGIGDQDPDILYSMNDGSGWTAPVAVNMWAASDLAVDDHPRLALGSGGKLYCVWQSVHDVDGAGSDWDIFFSIYDPATGWGTAVAVNYTAFTDNLAVYNNETVPNLAVRGDGSVLFTWQKDSASEPSLVSRGLTDSGWFNNGLPFESAGYGPVAMTTAEDGRLVMAWEVAHVSTGTRYIKWADVGSVGGFSFSSGSVTPTSIDSRYPQVATYGSGPTFERHFVWATRDSNGGIGTDWDIKHMVKRAASPTDLGPYTVNSTAATDGSSEDVKPSICVEAGGALHVVWESNLDLFGGTDFDTYYSHNGTMGAQWAPLGYLGLNAPFDDHAEDDYDAELRCGPLHVLSGMWVSMDDVGGTVGNDRDIFHALGLGRRYHRVRPAAGWAILDSDFDGRVRMAQQGGVAHLIWVSGNNGYQSAGTDLDIFHRSYRLEQFSNAMLVNSSGLGGSDGPDDDPDIAVDREGILHAVWSSEHDFGGTMGADADIFYAWTNDTGIWSVPELVNAGGRTDSIDDLAPLIEVDDNGILHVVWYERLSGIAGELGYARRTATGWTATETPTVPATTDWSPGSYDLALEPGGAPHVVWDSWADHGGSGPDGDIFWSTRVAGVWQNAQPVNDYATADAAFDVAPSLDAAPDGEIYAVWSSSHDPGGAGSDSDLFISKMDAAGEEKADSPWQPTFLLLEHFQTDSGEDSMPEISVGRDIIDVVWQSTEALAFNAAGTDWDIFHARVPRMSALPSDAAVGVANTNAFADSGDDQYPALAVLPGGTVLMAWESADDLGGRIGTDSDIVLGRLGETEGIFVDGFELGTTSAWSSAAGN